MHADKYGPRIPMGIILLCSAIPTGLTGLVNSAAGLTTLRFFIGIGGATFVMAQYWMSTMFTKEWVGTANAIVGGWGNLGGGITQILMGSFLFPLFRSIYDDSEKAWRTICIFPASLGIVTAYCVIMCTDDSPKGNFSKLKKQNEMEHVDMLKSFRDGACNSNTWLLFVQYACCFGVEITMNNAAALYFKEEFGLNTEQAAATASIFGWMNLFARGCGGFLSDRANMRWGMRGRLLWQSFVLFFEGCFVLIFAFSTNLLSAVVVLVFFSIFVQAAEGSTYGYVRTPRLLIFHNVYTKSSLLDAHVLLYNDVFRIVPYVNPPITGSISGIVGAGGNVGAVAFGLCFRQMAAKSAFLVMGSLIILSSILSLLIFIHGHPGLLWRTASEEDGVESSECSSTPMKMTRGPSVASSHAETAQSDAWSEERLEMHEMTLVEEEVDEELVDEQDLTI
jgi:NNP family nitrate/nitrite transporter-like MFS transporter